MGSCCSRPVEDDEEHVPEIHDEVNERTRLLPPQEQAVEAIAPPLTPQERQLLEYQDQWTRIVTRTSESFLDIAAVRSIDRAGAGLSSEEREVREADYRTRVAATTPPNLSMLRSEGGMTLVRPQPMWEVEDKGGVLQQL